MLLNEQKEKLKQAAFLIFDVINESNAEREELRHDRQVIEELKKSS